MPRLRNAATGVVVSCAEETAARLGGTWQDADVPQAKSAAKKATSTKQATRSDEPS